MTTDATPAAPVSSAPVSSAPVSSDVPCGTCGYNLRGLTMAGRCPECGTEVGPSVVAFRSGGLTERQRRDARAAAGMALGAVVLCLVAGPGAIGAVPLPVWPIVPMLAAWALALAAGRVADRAAGDARSLTTWASGVALGLAMVGCAGGPLAAWLLTAATATATVAAALLYRRLARTARLGRHPRLATHLRVLSVVVPAAVAGTFASLVAPNLWMSRIFPEAGGAFVLAVTPLPAAGYAILAVPFVRSARQGHIQETHLAVAGQLILAHTIWILAVTPWAWHALRAKRVPATATAEPTAGADAA
ncbi:MAG TPA: hypothetical protein VK324_00090 [Tepidisphaeraceae bacterium]|nr:hypothetical protein [Tepidisphaeraceae bacterium]